MKVFLTGATGFVGKNMLKRLLAEGHSVRALVRDPQKDHALAQGNNGPLETVLLIGLHGFGLGGLRIDQGQMRF